MTAVAIHLLMPPCFVLCRKSKLDHPRMVGQNNSRK